MDPLDIVNSELKPHILAFAEHHQIKSSLDVTNVNNYVLVADFCRTNKEKGGVAIYIKTDFVSLINPTSLKWINKFNIEGVSEFCGVMLSINGTVVTLLAVYRPPNADVSLFFKNFITIVQKILNKSKIIVVGDYNIHFIDKIDSVSKQFFDIINSFNLEIKINTHTRITESSRSCIDNVLADIDGCQADVIVTSLSDHDGLLIKLKLDNKLILNNIQKQRVITKQSIEWLKNQLSKQN